MKTKYYIIDGVNYHFSSMREVRTHFQLYSENDRKEMNGAFIYGNNSEGELTSTHVFLYENGRIIIANV